MNETRHVQRKKLEYKSLTLIIISINILVFLIVKFLIFKDLREIASQNGISMFSIPERVDRIITNNVIVTMGAKYGPLIYKGEVWRLLTSAFLHAELLHIGCNMFMLYSIGPLVQSIFGKGRYLSIYIVSCITSSLLSLFINPDTISLGASGGIFGLMGALLSFIVIEKDRINKEFSKSIISNIVFNLFLGLAISNVDNAGHIGGVLGGIILGYILYKLKLKRTIIETY